VTLHIHGHWRRECKKLDAGERSVFGAARPAARGSRVRWRAKKKIFTPRFVQRH